MPAAQTVDLLCHPSTPTDAVRAIAVRVSRSTDGVLALNFRLVGDISRIRIPAPCAPRFAHQLWEHTCCEAFLAAEGAATYHELNLAPSGEWAGYAFAAYRQVAGLADEALAPRIVVRPSSNQLELGASIALACLSPLYAGAALRVGLSAVVEEIDHRLSYWALCHPSGRPDFHHRDARALQLAPRSV